MKSLKIQNLILIEKAEIAFGPGLNIITGETGSGKSAVLSAIRLIAGERADAACIRTGAEFAIVEAVLEGPVFIRREIHRSGKNRCFIDEAQVSLSALRQAVNIEMVDQSSSHTLLDQQKQMLDLFAHLTLETAEYEKSYAAEREKEEQLKKLEQVPKERELEWALKDLELIEETHLQEGEEEKLNAEHHFLTHAQELAQKIGLVAETLSERTELKRALTFLEQCIRFDPKLAPTAQAMKSALLELEEVGREVQSYTAKLDADPARLTAVEERISAIESLKRRFGPNIREETEKLKNKIDQLAHLDGQIASLKTSLSALREKNQIWSAAITKKRREAAVPFASQVLAELKSLNIPHAQFEISVKDTFGDICFLFSANPGSPPISVHECASGGELSRLLLAIKTILADGQSTLVFDEIDSNVGGQTAAILGQKLKKLAAKRQVICVTHFVQVAKCALDHFLVTKTANQGHSYTLITKLSEKEKEIEYDRMLGNKL